MHKIKHVIFKLRNIGTNFLNATASVTEFGNSFREEMNLCNDSYLRISLLTIQHLIAILDFLSEIIGNNHSFTIQTAAMNEPSF